MSQVGCRLMVASGANTSRPLAPAACGDIARALATKAAMSSEADGFVSGNEPALPDADFCAEETSVADFGLVGSPDISGSQMAASLMWAGTGVRSMCARHAWRGGPGPGPTLPSVLDRRVERDGPRLGHQRRRLGGIDGLERAVVIEEFVEHALDRRLGFVRAGVAHVVMLEPGLNNRNAGLLAYFVGGDDAGVGLED